jgi:hypothetical protein
MKISLISFDFWDYDHYIVKSLLKKGIDAHHIKIGCFKHKNFQDKAVNAFSKVFLGKNLKHEKRQEFIKDSIKKNGFQDQILVLNADTIDLETLIFVKKHTNKLITYLYDNLSRFPVQEKLYLFDKVYSFDDEDIKQYGFEKLTNYNYLDYLPQEKQNPSMDLFYITSFDKFRNKTLIPLAENLKQFNINYRFVVVGKKGWKEQVKFFGSKRLKNHVVLKQKIISTKTIAKTYEQTKAILDLMREGQTGLSFRVFEAMALEKKIVTNNEKIKEYDFYNENNILILDKDLRNLSKDFFNTPYERIPKNIYEKYILGSWVDRVFEL